MPVPDYREEIRSLIELHDVDLGRWAAQAKDGYQDGIPYLPVVYEGTYGASACEEILINSNSDAARAILDGYEVEYVWPLMDSQELCVRVYDECEGHESLAGEHMGETVYCDGSCRGGFSEAFIVGAYIRSMLVEYPILDDDDHSEREFNAGMAIIDDILESHSWGARKSFDDDSDEDHEAIKAKLSFLTSTGGVDMAPDGYCPDVIDERRVIEAYATARDTYFAEKGRDYLTAQIEGQGVLDIALNV